MYSYCCNALVDVPGARFNVDSQFIPDWLECSKCHRPCDRVKHQTTDGEE